MIKNRFRELLLEKAAQAERRNIPLLEVARETNLTTKTLYAWDDNSISRYDASSIEALCNYFNCDLCDLLVLQKN